MSVHRPYVSTCAKGSRRLLWHRIERTNALSRVVALLRFPVTTAATPSFSAAEQFTSTGGVGLLYDTANYRDHAHCEQRECFALQLAVAGCFRHKRLYQDRQEFCESSRFVTCCYTDEYETGIWPCTSVALLVLALCKDADDRKLTCIASVSTVEDTRMLSVAFAC